MVHGGMSIVKYLLFAFNLIFVIFGILLVYSGISTAVKLDHYSLIIKNGPSTSAIVLVAIGFIIFLIAFLGCCGAIKENYCMLCSFGGVILVILIVELIGAGLVLAFRKELKKAVGDGLNTVIEKYDYNNTDLDYTKIMDDLQHNLKCCGSHDKKDWLNPNKTAPLPPGKFPSSCCDEAEEDAGHHNVKFCTDKSPKTKIYDKGCLDVLDDEIRHVFGLLGGIAIAIAVIQVFGIIFACCLGRSIRKEYEVV